MDKKNIEKIPRNEPKVDVPKLDIKPNGKVEIKPTNIFDLKHNENISELLKNTNLARTIGVNGLNPNYSSLLNSLNIGLYNNLDIKKLGLFTESYELSKKYEKILIELNEEKDNKVKLLEKQSEQEEVIRQIQKNQKIRHILTKIGEKAQDILLQDSSKFIEKFNDGSISKSVVLSIDIRRSTELMLKSRKPELYSKFITELSDKLSENIKANFGVFDKFTGDGILAFFPEFYSGEKAIIFAIKSAIECHKIFIEHYNNSRNCFNVFIKDIGLGIGIDFGNVTLVNNGNELTVVGIPVVYACRFSGAKAGDTLLNIPAFEEISEKCKSLFSYSEVELEIKNEGKAIGYKILLNDGAFGELPDPIWE